MKIRHYLFVILTAAAVAGLVANVGPIGNADHMNGFLNRMLGPTHAFAQATGYVGWNNLHMAFVNSDFTDGSAVTSLQNIPSLQFYLPAKQSGPFRLDCDLFYSQGTVVADNFGIQFSIAPTAEEVGGFAYTNATTVGSGTPNTTADTAAHNVISFTPAVSTVLYAHIGGFIEQASNTTDTTVNISVAQSTAADVIVVKRDSVCMWHSMN